jgi:signal transduction histidine kinase
LVIALTIRNRAKNLKHLSIRYRILLIFIVIVLVGSATQLFIAGYQLQMATLEFYQHHLETDALLIAANLSESMEDYHDDEGTGTIQRTVATFQQNLDYGYLIVDHQYQVLAYTANSGYENVQRLAETPELAQARQKQIGADIRDDAFQESTLYLAVPIYYEQETLGYLVLFEPMQPAYDEVMQRWFGLAFSLLPIVGLVIIASLWISSTIVRPIEKLRNSALRMARGHLDTRIDEQGHDEIGQLAQTFNYMAGQIESLMKSQQSFVSYAAHELRSPLMTLKLRAEVLMDERLSAAERNQYLREIDSEINHMADLVSSLLVLARIDEGRHEVNDTSIDIGSSLSDTIRHWRIAAENKGLTLEAEMPPESVDLPLAAADLRLILDNLLGNAIKYSTSGSIILKVSGKPESGWTIHVQDNGIGFEPDEAEHIFERFYRSPQVRGQYQGHGLGLAIVAAIIKQYGGSMSAESKGIGTGARFTLALPVAP